MTFLVDCKAIWKKRLAQSQWAEQNPNRWCRHFLTGTCEGSSYSHHLLGRKQNTSLCSLVCCCHLSSLLTDPSFLLTPGEGSHAPYPMEAWGGRLGSNLVSVGIYTEREEWTSKILRKRKYLWENAIGKLRKHWALFPSGYAFLLFWVSKVNQRNRAESWDYWERLQLGFQSLPTYFKEKQQALFKQCILLPSWAKTGCAEKRN